MKKVVVIASILILVLLLWWLLCPCGVDATFNGTLHDSTGKPVAGAVVSVGDKATVTDEEGNFHLKGASVERGRWVLEVRRAGFAPISKVFHQGSENTVLTVVGTTRQVFDAGSAIVARDTRNNCIGSAASGDDWAAYPLARFLRVVDADGNRVTGPVPLSARRTLEFLSGTQPCTTGFQISIPANGLVGGSGRPVQGQVQVELSTVDLRSADGMPGDYTVESDEGPLFMESFGAGTVEVRAGDEVLQLQKGSRAEIVIPVDRGQIAAGSKIPPTIPLLRYGTKTGKWRTIGEARLDREQMAYVGEVEHFSEFNADVVKTNPACLRFDASGISGNFDLVITAPTSSGGFKTVTKSVQPDTSHPENENTHAIYNLPPNEWVVLRAIKGGTPEGTWIFQTGPSWGSSGPPTYDYDACGTIFNLSETVGASVTHNGSNHRFGPLPKHVAFLVNTSGATEDVYPVGLGAGGGSCVGFSDCWYLFSLFDTGSNLVVIDSTITPLLGLSMTPTLLWDVDVRINGLGNVASNLTAPYGEPGALDGAEAHSGVLRVAPRPVTIVEEETRTDSSGNPVGSPEVGVSYILAGTPVTNNVVARIDYTSAVTRGPWNFGAYFSITAPDIQFYQPGDGSIPTPALTLFLEGFGTPAANPTGTTDQRHFLQNVTFTHGTANVIDDQTSTSPVRFLFDTATTFTVISQAMAISLGTTPTSPDPAVGCSSNNTANFVTVDSMTIVGMNSSDQLATYRITNAEVCVDVGGSMITTNYPDPSNPTGPPLIVDAVIGSNLFDQAEVLWDGPKRTLGILP